MATEIAIEGQGLSKRFGSIEALRDVALAVPVGQTYGLLGPNGSGKTTFIRLVAGLLRPTAGRLTVLGQAMPSRRILGDIGYMPQTPALYLELTVRENLLFFARIYGAADRDCVEEVLDVVGLSERADSPVYALSGGMRQRTSLACALVHSPRLLLLDEPTVGVDPPLRVAFWQYFRRLNQEGVTILVSSHVMDEAERCDRLVLLRDGRILAEGSAGELRQQAGAPTLEEAFLRYAEDAGELG
jgi:ABC-2 type transport system ATP-binding protein